MTRVIKFRAWHEGHPSKGKYDGVPAQMLFDDKPGDCLVYLSQGQPVEVMQFTGLKDKNGVEIYEGDILSDGTRKFKVFIVPGGLAINTHQDDLNKENIVFYESTADMQTSSFISGTTEVIGNIHQNQELL